MKIKPLFICILTLISTGCSEMQPSGIKKVTALEMQNHMKYDNLQVVDVQPREDYNQSHLLNAQNIIYDKDFRKNLERLDKSLPVAIYCSSGKVSLKAAEILKDAGFRNIYVLEGGIRNWMEEKQEIPYN